MRRTRASPQSRNLPTVPPRARQLTDGLHTQEKEADGLARAAGGLEELGAQDAAMVEQAAAAATNLKESAQRLLACVRIFKVS